MNRFGVTTATALAATGTLALAACGGDGETAPVMQSTDGLLRVVFQADAKWQQDDGRREMESALARFASIDVVYAHNDPMARGAQLAAEQAGRTGILFIGIDALPHEGVRYVQDGKLDATFEYPTGGRAAVDLGVLLASGREVPRDIVLGTHEFTKANVGAGGAAIEAGGGVDLAAIRTRATQALAERESTAPLRIGMSQCNLAEPWRTQMNADVRARAAELGARIELLERDAQNDVDAQREQILELVQQGVDAILVSPKESIALVPAAQAARAAGIPVVVLDRRLGSDDYSCFIGGDNVAIGRAAGEFVGRTLGSGGGTIVELTGLWTSSPAQERHRGFVEALGLK